MTAAASTPVEAIWRKERRRVLATLIRVLGSFDAAEDACQEAFVVAARTWPQTGVPANPYSWLVSTGRFRMIDTWRRRARLAAALPDMARLMETAVYTPETATIRDDELRLFFTCCHPTLPPDAQIALTLREVGGLTTEEVARAFLTSASTMAQRIVRAKARIRDEQIPYCVPEQSEYPARLETVLRVVYLIFNEGYTATSGRSLTRSDLCLEAIRLTRLLKELVEDPEVSGLLALMLLHEARRATRVDENGDIVLLEDQDRSRWDRAGITVAQSLIEEAFRRRSVGSYTLQAAIAAVHANAPTFDETDWPRIVALYDALVEADPSPVVDLNRAIAVGMRDGPGTGLERVDAVLAAMGLATYAPAHAARATFLSKLGHQAEAQKAYAQASALASHPAERRAYDQRSNQLYR
ncbi:RNA polymerase sigma factor [Tabrizicola piscis]|uniref:RNA polymerase sigma factor n=1 Tax=Tabrizicola piscis TaxID=2494374 RepID=A0A3S8U2G7_9RHOB|nr:RNA polymerase sigma factor [Tabrizicola piscis]AZL57765.1 RNA polymerase sigma factor [Tabrizicola piscis]